MLLEDIKRAWTVDGELVLYQPLEHPELAGCKVQQPCKERFKMILNSLTAMPNTVLDLGCHTGWFCRAFSRLGCRTIGVDRRPFEIEIASVLMKPYNGPTEPEYLVSDLFDLEVPEADIVLCLSVFMYLFEDEYKGWDLLSRISRACPVMFFDFGGMYASKLPFNEATVIQNVLANTEYDRIQFIGRTDLESRPLFKASR